MFSHGHWVERVLFWFGIYVSEVFRAVSIVNLLLLQGQVMLRKIFTCFEVSPKATTSSSCIFCQSVWPAQSFCPLMMFVVKETTCLPMLIFHFTPLASFCLLVGFILLFVCCCFFLASVLLLSLVLLRKWHPHPCSQLQPCPLHEQSLRELATGLCQSCHKALKTFLSRSLSEGKTLLFLSLGNV